MANAFYNRGASFNPDELADGDAIEAEFDSVVRGFNDIETRVDTNKAGYPTQTFHVAPATETTHAVRKEQLDTSISSLNNSIAATNDAAVQLKTEVDTKLPSASYTAADVLAKVKTVDGTGSGLDADLLGGYAGNQYARSFISELVAGSNWNDAITYGAYKVNGANAGVSGAPPCSYGLGVLVVEVAEVGGEGRLQQTYYPHNKDMDKFFYHRMRNQGVWTEWSLLWRGDAPYAKSNILGTVNQSSGVPTGAVIERGSNANGQYVKFADGTLICTQIGKIVLTDATLYGDFDGNWAASFLGSPVLSAAVHEVYFGGARFAMSLRQVFSDDVKYRVTISSSYGSTLNYTVKVMAIGRWF